MLGSIWAALKDKTYRVRETQKKINCPHPDYSHAFIVLPAEWLGIHAIRKDKAVELAKKYESTDITNFAVSMALLDDWQNIPGLDSKRIEDWDFNKVPMPILSWVIQEVLVDFNAAYIVPKAS